MIITPILKKYAKYLWILLPVILIILFIIFKKAFSKQKVDPNQTKETQELAKYITEVGTKLEEAHQVAVVETVIAQTKDAATGKSLEDIKLVDDDAERRKKLLDLYAQVQVQKGVSNAKP